MKIKILFPLLLAVLCGVSCCPASNESPVPRLSQRQIVFQKTLPLTFALEVESRAVLGGDSVLRGIGLAKYQRLLAGDVNDSPQIGRFSEEEAEAIGNRLGELSPGLQKVIAELRASGKYCLFEELPDDGFVKAAWKADAGAMNHIIDVYALGQKPRYAGIDSIDFDPYGGELRYVRNDICQNVLLAAKDGPFYAVTLEMALDWLDANGRSEAADFEPMEGGINKAAYEALPSVRWENYPYSVILVLGCGPEKVGEPISAQSRMRARYAALLYKEGKAPVVVVSGGRVHPFKTPYSEAEEMKRYLMETWGIPEAAIIAEPHARHTTTNIRNTVRIMMERGVPLDKPGLITSGSSHIDYVCGDYFLGVCQREMWTVPFLLGNRLSSREIEFYPLPSARLVAASEDPLDP